MSSECEGRYEEEFDFAIARGVEKVGGLVLRVARSTNPDFFPQRNGRGVHFENEGTSRFFGG